MGSLSGLPIKAIGPHFPVGTRFMAPDGSIGRVVSIVMDTFMPIYNVSITDDPDGVVHGHIAEYEVCEPGWQVCAPGSITFTPIMEGS